MIKRLPKVRKLLSSLFDTSTCQDVHAALFKILPVRNRVMSYYALVVILGLLIVIKIYLKLTTRWATSYVTLVGKTAVITGANSGIGYMTAMEFAKRGARVILACRNKERAENAQRTIMKETNNKNIVVRLIDMCSFESVRYFAKIINETEETLDILVNNAGGLFLGDEKTVDGLQVTMQVNHFSHFLLTSLLLDKLKNSAPSRIINVSSNGAFYAQLNTPDEINEYPKKWSEPLVYANSKLCNILFTVELAKKLAGTNVTVNALHPGVIVTTIVDGFPTPLYYFYILILKHFVKTPEEGAQTTIHLAVSEEVAKVNGKFFVNCRQAALPKAANHACLSRGVWLKTVELIKQAEEGRGYDSLVF